MKQAKRDLSSLRMELSNLNPNKCWEWKGNCEKKGYGQVKIKGVTFKTHRLSWLLFNGGGLTSLDVLHRCDNPKCFNPNHLFLGTHAENNKDRDEKSRQARGVRIMTTKLDPVEVRTIRKLSAEGVSMASLARRFGVNFTTISAIVKRKTWKYI